MEAKSEISVDYDKHSILFRDQITSGTTEALIQAFQMLKDKNPDRRITLYLDSCGGSIPAGLKMIDYWRINKSVFDVVSAGRIAGMAFYWALCGQSRTTEPGHLWILAEMSPGGMTGKFDDLRSFNDYVLKMKEHSNQILQEKTKMIDNDELQKIVSRVCRGDYGPAEPSNHFFTAEDCLRCDLVDAIVSVD